MLIQFSVTNFRSFKETQSLVMETDASTKELSGNIHSLPLPGRRKKHSSILKSAAIYGPNASGKSTFVDALGYMRFFIIESNKKQRGDEINWVSPFRLDSATLHQPSVFEAAFILQNAEGKNIKYEYGFAATNERIVEEWLFEYRSSHATKLFVRAYDPKKRKTKWIFKEGLKVSDIHKRTLENTLFLSKAAQENHAHLAAVFDWFRQTLIVEPSQRDNDSIIRKCIKNDFEGRKSKILHFLKDADIGITDLQILQKNIHMDEKDFHPNTSSEQRDYITDQLRTRLQSVHIMNDTKKKVAFDFFNDESDGTIAMLALASILIESVDKARVIVIDELCKSLHPLLIKELILAFHKFSKNSQLIFTTHDLQQMDEELFRKDQIWLMNKKRPAESSDLYRLSDLRGIRKEHAFDRRYLLGAYGALPLLGKFDLSSK